MAKMMSSQMSLPAINGPRLIVIAAILHVSFALVLFVAGRAGVAPRLIDRDGIMGSFAFDSYDYQRGASETSQLLRSGNLRAWANAAEPLHVKLIAVPFALLSPVSGYSPLSAEPYNLFFYLAIVCLVFALGSELGGRRAGIFAAVLVALWPTFLLHTLQLLKDSLFITAALAFLWCAITLLSRTYTATASAGVSLIAILLLLLLAFVRGGSVLLLVAVAILILGLLIVRQATERRLLFWNMLPAVAILLIGLILAPFISGRTIHYTKKYSSDQIGPLKNVADREDRMPTVIVWKKREPSGHSAAGDRFARRISSIRSRFAASYSNAGSLLDAQTEFRNVGDLLRYIPRAFEIGMWAPFPSTWFFSGRRVGNLGKIISGLETLAIYLLQVTAVLALIREPRRPARWFVIAIIICGVTALAFVIPNTGAIYRFRYVFWILLIVAAISGPTVIPANGRKPGGLKQFMITLVLAGMPAVVHGCSSYAPRQNAGLSLTNFTGTAFSAVYLSPSSALDWQENLLLTSTHNDGDTLDIQFDRNESNMEWDLKVQGIDGHYAEWKNLKLQGPSEITLVLKLSSTPVVAAEVE
jgi:hypothetical protein